MLMPLLSKYLCTVASFSAPEIRLSVTGWTKYIHLYKRKKIQNEIGFVGSRALHYNSEFISMALKTRT